MSGQAIKQSRSEVAKLKHNSKEAPASSTYNRRAMIVSPTELLREEEVEIQRDIAPIHDTHESPQHRN